MSVAVKSTACVRGVWAFRKKPPTIKNAKRIESFFMDFGFKFTLGKEKKFWDMRQQICRQIPPDIFGYPANNLEKK
jgi:hypothetical protein